MNSEENIERIQVREVESVKSEVLGGIGLKKVYETERLVLKSLDSSSWNLILDYHIRNKEFLKEWEPLRLEAFYKKELQQKQLENDLVHLEKGTGLRLWIFKRGIQDKTIGCIAFNNIVRGAFLSCHLGYKLDKDEINQGYITEALKKGIDIIFKGYQLHRIEANIMPKNKGSLAVVEKLGFKQEGLARDYLKINGKWEDHIHMVLLNDKV